MAEWKIYHKDGTAVTDTAGSVISIKALEYTDAWMGECYVTLTIENPYPIDFVIGDYITYRGEKFEMNYDPGKIKVARKGSYGGAFKYDSVKLNSQSDELARTEFLDVVLGDNQMHYTAMPKFSFYVSSLDDLLDRIQANLNEQTGAGEWKLFSRNKERSVQRGCTEAEWTEAYGEGTEDNTIESKSVTVDSKTCWEALALINSEWDVNFIVRGRCVYVGTAGIPTANIFKYGKGKGLYEIEQNAESDQKVITRLRAYGSTTNLPTRYYATISAQTFANVESSNKTDSTDGSNTIVILTLGLDWNESARCFTDKNTTISSYDGTKYNVTMKAGDVSITGWVRSSALSDENGRTAFVADSSEGKATKAEITSFYTAAVSAGKVYFTGGIEKTCFPAANIETASDALPDNMSCERLMLPGFPTKSLNDYYNGLTDAQKSYVNPTGKEHRFSTDQYRPYIDSLNIDTIGMRPGSAFFDTDDETNGIIDIYPTMEEMEIDGVRVDEIYKGSEITDNGVYKDGQTVPNFEISLNPKIDFALNDLAQDDFAIAMKDGMCGGRTFSVAGMSKQTDGSWRLTLQRQKDSDLDLYFPYCDYQINAGDHFVLTGIELPDSYIEAASLKLLKYAIAYLDENDYTRYVYQPKVDEIFMARQHDKAMADTTGAIKSLHDTLKAGDLMKFEDGDLGIDGEITIDQLQIKEADGAIPTYEITLREDKEVSTITKIQNQVSSLAAGSGNGGSGSGATATQVRALVPSEGGKYFLSKLDDDTAAGIITLLKGLKVGNNGYWDVDADGGTSVSATRVDAAKVDATTATLGEATVDEVRSTNASEADRTLIGGNGFELYKGTDGRSHLWVDDANIRGKLTAASLEIRKVSYSGGTILLSNAGSTIQKVAAVVGSDGTTVTHFKCWCKADDGTTKTMNWWKVGMMALCKTFNVSESDGENGNRYYWRLVVGVGQETLDDGKLYDWVLLSNIKTFKGSDSVIPNYSTSLLANESGEVLTFGGYAISLTSDDGMTTFAEVAAEEYTDGKDCASRSIADVTYYGYDASADTISLPKAGDVIVQAGDQINWNGRGNVIKLTTSADDDTSEANVPSLTMYHGMGNNTDGKPYQWRVVTAIISPLKTLFNSNYFKFFTNDDPTQEVEIVATTYEIIPSAQFVKIVPRTSCNVDWMTFDVKKCTGGTCEILKNQDIDVEFVLLDGTTREREDDWSAISASDFYNAKSCTVWYHIFNDAGEQVDVARLDIPILQDGADGTSVTIKDTLTSTAELPTSGQTAGDGYLINGDLWTYTGTTLSDETHVHGFTNVGTIQGPQGENGHDGADIYYVPNPIVFEAGNDGLVDLTASPNVDIKDVWLGCNSGTIKQIVAAQGSGCEVTADGETITFTSIDTKEYTVTSGGTTTTKTMSVNSGYVAVILLVAYSDGTTQQKNMCIGFSVAFTQKTASLEVTQDSIKATVKEQITRIDSMPSTVVKSSVFEQTANEIKASVKEDINGELTETGIDIANKKITAKADSFEVQNNSGEKTAEVDKTGTIAATSFRSSSADNTMFVTIQNGALSIGTTKNGAGAHFGFDENGAFALFFYNAEGRVICSIGENGYETAKLTVVGHVSLTTDDAGKYNVSGGMTYITTSTQYVLMYSVKVNVISDAESGQAEVNGNSLHLVITSPMGKEVGAMLQNPSILVNGATQTYEFTKTIAMPQKSGDTYYTPGTSFTWTLYWGNMDTSANKIGEGTLYVTAE